MGVRARTALVTGVRKHRIEVRGQDLYETPPEAVEALLRVEDIPEAVWEPACSHGAIARVHAFRNRLPMMHRGGWQGPLASSAICFGWFSWNTAHCGPTVIQRVSWGAAS